MKKLSIFIVPFLAFAIVSCGGSKEQKSEKNEVVCEVENKIAVTVQDYYYSMSDTLEFNTASFEIKQSKYEWLNDSTVSLKFMNYTEDEFEGRRTENQMDINIELNARKGKKLEPGYYKYHDYESGMWSRVTLTTAYGTVWFNWNMGMPEQGGITIEHVSKEAVCGTLSLNVENPESSTIGIVKVNGPFVYKK